MAPPKIPKSLYEQCQRKVNLMILKVCAVFERRGCTYANRLQVESFITRIQQYLLSNIPGYILDDLCNNIYNHFPPRLPAAYMDSRIYLSVYLHENMRKFSVHKIPVLPDDPFWIKKLPNLRKLIILDLRDICTDEILEAIGNNCSLLEEVNIFSKYECHKVYNGHSHTVFAKYLVSDLGLKHLCRCKNLKKIDMIHTFNIQIVTGLISHYGIRELLKSLPKLQYISYNDVGMIVDKLVGEMNELQLTHIEDSNPCSKYICSYDKLCPNLRVLYLNQPENVTERTSNVEIMKALTHSKLQLMALKLEYFPVDNHFEDFLKLKGTFLKFLHILCSESITSDELIIIGTLCPNLEDINLTNLTSRFSEFKNHNLAEGAKMFSSLQSLMLSGRCWSPHVILPICVKYALDLNHIVLCNRGYTGIIDDTLNEIMSVNPLNILQRICLLSGCLITVRTVAMLASCSCLTYLKTEIHPALDLDSCIKLIAEMKNRNITLVFDNY